MPWTPEDSTKHSKKADTSNKKKRWAAVANSVLESCLADGGDQKTCESKAITQASGVIAKLDENESYNYLVDISNIELEEKDGKKSSWIEIFREGSWTHPKWGLIEGTKKLFNDFIDNWKNNVLGRDIAIDRTHDPSEGATGWVKDMKIVGDKLKALVEWTPWGIELIEQKGFKYFSPEYRDSYTDKESGKEYRNVLFGGGITNRPFLTNLNPIVLSEDIENQCFKQANDEETQESFWLLLEEYADHDEEKIRSILDAMDKYMKETMDTMKTKDGKIMINSVIKRHMKQMMYDILEEMQWVKIMPKQDMVKSNY